MGSIDYGRQPVFEIADGSFDLVEGSVESAVANLSDLLIALGMERPLVVSGHRFDSYWVRSALDDMGIAYTRFDGFSPNPRYEEVAAGVTVFRESECDSLLSVGGGSAIDVAKCIKRYACMEGDGIAARLANQACEDCSLRHIAIPTTAGTGSESTHFAVMYVDGAKTSVSHESLHPDAVVLDAGFLESLPDYQKKATLLDALCQAIESYWSVRSDEPSRMYACRAIGAIVSDWEDYLNGDIDAARSILRAANLSGKAINLTTTTAAHAMSYKLTSLYGLPHGHAVAACMPHVWHLLVAEGGDGVHERLCSIASLMTQGACGEAQAGLLAFESIIAAMNLPKIDGSMEDIDVLVDSVNLERLSNFPMAVSKDQLRDIYAKIV